MRLRVHVLALVLCAASPAALAQTLDQARADCMAADPETKIKGCTADIQSGQETRANLAVAFNNRAAALDAKGLHDQAISDATQALEINPDYASAFNERAWAYHGKGQDRLGLPDAERAVQLAPNDPYSLETRAEIFEALGERARAVADYRAALALAPDMRPARIGLDRMEGRAAGANR